LGATSKKNEMKKKFEKKMRKSLVFNDIFFFIGNKAKKKT